MNRFGARISVTLPQVEVLCVVILVIYLIARA